MTRRKFFFLWQIPNERILWCHKGRWRGRKLERCVGGVLKRCAEEPFKVEREHLREELTSLVKKKMRACRFWLYGKKRDSLQTDCTILKLTKSICTSDICKGINKWQQSNVPNDLLLLQHWWVDVKPLDTELWLDENVYFCLCQSGSKKKGGERKRERGGMWERKWGGDLRRRFLLKTRMREREREGERESFHRLRSRVERMDCEASTTVASLHST